MDVATIKIGGAKNLKARKKNGVFAVYVIIMRLNKLFNFVIKGLRKVQLFFLIHIELNEERRKWE